MVSAFWQECCIVVVPVGLACCCLPLLRWCCWSLFICGEEFDVRLTHDEFVWISNISGCCRWNNVHCMLHFLCKINFEVISIICLLLLLLFLSILCLQMVSFNCLLWRCCIISTCIFVGISSSNHNEMQLWNHPLRMWICRMTFTLHFTEKYFLLLIRFIHFHSIHSEQLPWLWWWSAFHSRCILDKVYCYILTNACYPPSESIKRHKIPFSIWIIIKSIWKSEQKTLSSMIGLFFLFVLFCVFNEMENWSVNYTNKWIRKKCN